MPTYLDTLAKRHLVAEQTELARLEIEERNLARLQSQAESTQLLESCSGHDHWAHSDPFHGNRALDVGLGSASNDLLQYGAIGRNTAHPGARRHGAQPPFYWTEPQHRMIVDAARTVEAFCPTAVSVLDVLEQFAIFTGFSYKVVRKKKPGDTPPSRPADDANGEPPAAEGEPQPAPADPEVDAAQELIDKWQKAVKWHTWEKEIFRRSRRDGEVFIAMDPDDETGMLGLRAIEPEQIREPTGKVIQNQGSMSWRFGILTTKDDTSKPLGYWVVSQFAEEPSEMIPPEEMYHLKLNVDRQSKRGVSDFFCNANSFPRVMKLLRSLTESAKVQADIAWIKTHPEGHTVTPLSGGQPVTGHAGQRTPGINSDGPDVLDVQNGMEYEAGPLGLQGKNAALILVLQAALRNIGARWQMPESLVSGDASNNNLASELAVAAPFVHAMECRQDTYGREYVDIHERVLEDAGVNMDELEVTVEMPPVIPRDAKGETERNAILSDHGILGNSSWSAREDLDREDELADMERDPIQPPSIMLGMEGEGLEGDGQGQAADSEDGQADTPGVKQPRQPRSPKASETTSPKER